jgi:hypothetical protein
VRFYSTGGDIAMPRKIGGYKQLTTTDNIARGIYVLPNPPDFNVYIGDQDELFYIPIDQFGNVLGPVQARTPYASNYATGTASQALTTVTGIGAVFIPAMVGGLIVFTNGSRGNITAYISATSLTVDSSQTVAAQGYTIYYHKIPQNANNDWQFDTMYSTINNSALLIAFAAPNLSSIASMVESAVYYGDALATTPLAPTGFNVSGGIVVLSPFLVMYGNDGGIIISNANDPTTELFNARITNSKIVYALPVRGGNSSPSALFWSLDSLIRMTTVGGAEQFSFDTVTAQSSILSSRGVIEYDNVYYWAAVDRFLYYQGVVQELVNNKSLDFFFSNLNYRERQKVWATKVTAFGEIWWFYPSGDSTECDRTLIFNVRHQCWYDTPINRSDGYFDQTFSKPIWTDNVPNGGGKYPVWIHETGVDQNVGNVLTAIDSFIQTGDIAYCANGPGGERVGLDRWVYLTRVEPDFVQTGELTLTVSGRDYARSNPVSSNQNPYLITEDQLKQDMREQAREMRLKFRSNVINGNYFMGNTLLVLRIGDGRQSGNTV